ncbi:Merozoite surface protein 9 [Balamuthia mandrillaris]
MQLDFHQKKAKAPETMLVTLEERTLASHDLAFQQRLAAKKKPRPSRSIHTLWIRQAKGWKLVQEGYFSLITNCHFSFGEYYVCFDPWHCSCNFYCCTGKWEFPPESCPFDHPHPASVHIPTVESNPSNDSNSNPTNTSSDDSSHVYENTTSNDDKEEGTDDDHHHTDEAKAADADKDEEKEEEEEEEKEEEKKEKEEAEEEAKEEEKAHDGEAEVDDSEKEDPEWSQVIKQPMLNFSNKEER